MGGANKKKTRKKRTGGNPPFIATDKDRQFVSSMCALGAKQEAIASVLRVSIDTIQRHFREELDHAITEKNVQVMDALFRNATVNENVAAQIWWLKARAGWREERVSEALDEPLPRPLLRVGAEPVDLKVIDVTPEKTGTNDRD